MEIFPQDEFYSSCIISFFVIWPVLSGSQGKEILVFICDKYPNEFREAFFSFLKVGSSHYLLASLLVNADLFFFSILHVEFYRKLTCRRKSIQPMIYSARYQMNIWIRHKKYLIQKHFLLWNMLRYYSLTWCELTSISLLTSLLYCIIDLIFIL